MALRERREALATADGGPPEDFIVQGGDPTGTGRGGESIYGKHFDDEIHRELKHTELGNIRYLEEYVEEWKLSRDLAVFKLITLIAISFNISLPDVPEVGKIVIGSLVIADLYMT
ncbi:UNVERIFIED_CONTAM: Peptidyl-prolyl cis-trans isomerase CYP18-2 [Sesamum calycinum]|uniref:peptidylprolyl isomerase n=1 Tax=Sesamum calycinum TaxID=2727403 RepID=A0AAW2NTZ1_9LAMI